MRECEFCGRDISAAPMKDLKTGTYYHPECWLFYCRLQEDKEFRDMVKKVIEKGERDEN